MSPAQTFAYAAQELPLHSPGVSIAEIAIVLGVVAVVVALTAFASIEFHEMKKRRRHRLAVAKMREAEMALRHRDVAG